LRAEHMVFVVRPDRLVRAAPTRPTVTEIGSRGSSRQNGFIQVTR
jgi:hypothetical protein